MKLRGLSPKVNVSRGRVGELLAAARIRLPEEERHILHQFPRPIEDIAKIFHRQLNVEFVEQRSITDASVWWWLHEEANIDPLGLDVDDETPRLGFLYCHDNFVFVFYDPTGGEARTTFTKAHELGHIFLDYLPIFNKANQLSLGGERPEEAYLACRDTPFELSSGIGTNATPSEAARYPYASPRAYDEKEVLANAFAAEFLAPAEEVYRKINFMEDREEKINVISSTFGLSRQAATIRLDEIEPAVKTMTMTDLMAESEGIDLADPLSVHRGETALEVPREDEPLQGEALSEDPAGVEPRLRREKGAVLRGELGDATDAAAKKAEAKPRGRKKKAEDEGQGGLFS